MSPRDWQGAWRALPHGGDGQAALARELLSLIPSMAPYGEAASELVTLVKWLLAETGGERRTSAYSSNAMRHTYGRGLSSRSSAATADERRDGRDGSALSAVVTEDVLKGVVEALTAQNAVLANHPNSAIYGALQNLIDMDGYCLESEPCLACSAPEVSYSQVKLSAVKAETKYTDNRILLRLIGTHSLQALTLMIHSPRRSCMVRTVNLYYNNRPGELSDLVNCWPKWQKAGSAQLAPGQTEATLSLPLPVAALNLMVEFDTFHVAEQSAAQETLQCPRCSRAVTDRHGICRNCHENAYQCRQCRNINYEQLDAFLCNECGHSRYGRFDLSFKARPSCEHAPVEGDDDVQAARSSIEAETESAHRRFQQLAGYQKPLMKLLQAVEENAEEPREATSTVGSLTSTMSSTFRVNRNIAVLGVLYGEKCKAASDGVTRSMQAVAGARAALMEHLAPRRCSTYGVTIPTLRPPNGCYGCAATFIAHVLQVLEALTAASPAWRASLVRAGLPAELLRCNLHAGPQATRQRARRTLATLAAAEPAAAAELHALLRRKLDYVLAHYRSTSVAACLAAEMALLEEVAAAHAPAAPLAASSSPSALGSPAQSAEAMRVWEDRLLLVFEVLFSAVTVGGAANAAVCEHIVLPCLTVLQAASSPAPTTSTSSSVSSAVVSGGGGLSSSPSAALAAALRGSNGSSSSRRAAAAETAAATETHGQTEYAAWASGRDSFVAFKARRKRAGLVGDGGGGGDGGGDGGAIVINAPTAAERAALRCYLRWHGRVGMRAAAANAAAPAAAASSPTATRWTLGAEAAAPHPAPQHPPEEWVPQLLLSPASAAVRDKAADLIRNLATRSPHRHFKLLALLAGQLAAARQAGSGAAEFFGLLSELAAEPTSRRFLVARGFHAQLCSALRAEVATIRAREHVVATDVSQGFVLAQLARALSEATATAAARASLVKGGHLEAVVEVLAAVCSLEVHRTALTADAAAALQGVLAETSAQSDGHRHALVGACAAALRAALARRGGGGHSNTHAGLGEEGTTVESVVASSQSEGGNGRGREGAILLEQLCEVVCPEKPEPMYTLMLTKSPTQEEFIRGAMTKNPYASTEVGPLMRDVKNHICRTLDMHGLIEDDHGMELLVAGRIVSLDLPIARVYERVWEAGRAQPPSAATGSAAAAAAATAERIAARVSSDPSYCPPMPVVYRLQGLDGEATEPRVDEIEEEQEAAMDPEEVYKDTAVLTHCGGLSTTLDWLRGCRSGGTAADADDPTLMPLLLRLLAACCQLKTNRVALVQAGALPTLLRQAHHAFAPQADSGADAGTAQTLMLILERLISEATTAPAGLQTYMTLQMDGSSSCSVSSAAVDAEEQVHAFLERLEALVATGQRKHTDTVARILPFLAAGDQGALRALADHFLPRLDLAAFDALDEAERGECAPARLLRDVFVKVMESIPQSAAGWRLQGSLLDCGAAREMCAYLASTFAGAGSKGENAEAFAEAARRPGVPYALCVLHGLARGNCAAATKVGEAEGLLPLLHALEGVSSEGGTGTAAENLLEELASCTGDGLRERIEELRVATKEALRAKAMQRREAMLREMGLVRMVSPSGGDDRIVAAASPHSMEGGLGVLDDDDEEVVACMVCREGYTQQPQSMLALYCFSRRIRVRTAPPPSSAAAAAGGSSSLFSTPRTPASPLPLPPLSPGSSSAAAAGMMTGSASAILSPGSVGGGGSSVTAPSPRTPTDRLTSSTAVSTQLAYSTVSHFNAIHLSCHQAARRADAGLKTPKKEWEGAAVRNNETLCNNLLPMRAPCLSEDDYRRGCEAFWENLQVRGLDTPTVHFIFRRISERARKCDASG